MVVLVFVVKAACKKDGNEKMMRMTSDSVITRFFSKIANACVLVCSVIDYRAEHGVSVETILLLPLGSVFQEVKLIPCCSVVPLNLTSYLASFSFR